MGQGGRWHSSWASTPTCGWSLPCGEPEETLLTRCGGGPQLAHCPGLVVGMGQSC